jgi:hypothetical protein
MTTAKEVRDAVNTAIDHATDDEIDADLIATRAIELLAGAVVDFRAVRRIAAAVLYDRYARHCDRKDFVDPYR